ncbi:uncharacterized protein EI90DRAFT_3145274 [Cantharellus anzutake]|uniref:uncharacterized protein n=1 Tax=Cantharellus anzutake TaxID=1750568 RepID=UPI001906FCFF|nr:uncharacterized protein EI90DRAFT_3145274 [Cantharellus anzutake]KAF8333083.1 hypothetical protein EI90DRAFT_3145274 [Cantharellus anzutake]
MGVIIPDLALENLHMYKYSGVDNGSFEMCYCWCRSILGRLCLNKFWTKIAMLFPRFIAPNTITLAGLFLVAVNFATLIHYDYQYLGETGRAPGPPQWIYFTWAAGLFIYQTLDACDGQARKTGMAGPLGELFDHGCDALNTILEVIMCLRALDLTRSWWTVASVTATVANFYLTTWEEFHTGLFDDITKGILHFNGGCPFDNWFASAMGLSPSIRQIPLKIAFMIFSAFGLGFNIIISYRNVYKSLKRGNSGLMPILRLLPFASVPLVGSPGKSIVRSGYMMPYLCVWGLEFAHLVNGLTFAIGGKVITAHITKTSFPFWNWDWLWIAIIATDGHAQKLLGRSPILASSSIGQAAVVFFSLGILLFSYGRYCTLVIQDITNYLGIACFTVRKKSARGEWKAIWELEAEKFQ